jgi:hypothetical protein
MRGRLSFRPCLSVAHFLFSADAPILAASVLLKRRIDKHRRRCEVGPPSYELRSVLIRAANSQPLRWLPLFWRPNPESGMALGSTCSWRTSEMNQTDSRGTRKNVPFRMFKIGHTLERFGGPGQGCVVPLAGAVLQTGVLRVFHRQDTSKF